MPINRKFRRYINTALIMAPMTMLMAIIGVLRNYGFHDGCALKWLMTWLTMFPIAYFFAFFVIPIANKLTGKIPFQE